MLAAVFAVCIIAAFMCRVLYAENYVSAPGNQTASGSGLTVDYSNSSNGYIAIKHSSTTRKIKLRVTYGDNADTYDLIADDTYTYFPLKYGTGYYTVLSYANVEGKKYAQEFATGFNATISDPMACYLYPNVYSMYDEGDSVVELASRICEGLTSDMEKISAVYKWVSTNINYDYILALNVQTGYVPDIESTLTSKTGICFDYSAVLCAMLRSQGIYTQLVMGKLNSTQYHAWNKVYVDGKWKMLDATYAGKYKSGCYQEESNY